MANWSLERIRKKNFWLTFKLNFNNRFLMCDCIGDSGAIFNETQKLDKSVPSGLTGIPNSIAYILNKINSHLHNNERWLGAALVPTGETHVADSINITSSAFIANGGNNTWGNWLQIIGNLDTPIQAGMVKFDPHRFFISAWQRNDTVYKVQIAYGTSGAAALASGNYTEFLILTNAGLNNLAPIPIMSHGQDIGQKVWVRVWAVGQVSGTLNFFIGLHEYIG